MDLMILRTRPYCKADTCSLTIVDGNDSFLTMFAQRACFDAFARMLEAFLNEVENLRKMIKVVKSTTLHMPWEQED